MAKENPQAGWRNPKARNPNHYDRIIQQAMAQRMMPIFEPLFSEDSFGYRPGRSANDAILRKD